MTDETGRRPPEAADTTEAKQPTPPSKTSQTPEGKPNPALDEAIDRATAAVGEDDGKR